MQLVRESKRLRRERKKARINNTEIGGSSDDFESDGDDDDDYDDGFQSLFEPEDFYVDDDGDNKGETIDYREKGQFWTVDAHSVHDGGKQQMEPW
ncbi:hypothetical protein C1H46_045863 [Malus baccata]|uniref:Uncharacterized protein n=1 Tax=Malus baccata TaxID=106549 RepID=A0A540K2U7_MALBA|nr:hypothetical protein C1H46_045863 [Malus baccata]